MFAILSAGIAPAFALMSYIYLRDRFSEPLALIIRAFLYGALLVFPIMFIQYALIAEAGSSNGFIQSFLFASLLEEFFKWFIFLYAIYQHTAFDKHYDGIIYAVAISLGFATVENILYLFTNGLEYAVTRALFPVSSHALFGVIMGYYFGKAKMSPLNVKRNIALALIIPVLLHGIYNYILHDISSNWLYLLIPFMAALWAIGLKRLKLASLPHSRRQPLDQKKEA